ncbi:MAG: hypothetical protein JO122_17690 [Acetobacteraceae bacterium]|nr:hypothetical protein [Acetobacteraceae bacterium]
MAVDEMLVGQARYLTLDHLANAFRNSSLRHVRPDSFADVLEQGAAAVVDPDVMTGLKGRTRRAGHDVRFRR